MSVERFGNPFPGDSYDTPDGVPHSLWDDLFFRTRIWFYLRNNAIFVQSGWLANHTPFDGDAQTSQSFKNIRLIESLGGRIHLRGLNNLDKLDGSPAVIIGNHMSLLETALIHAFLRPRLSFCYIIKKQLLDVPFFSAIMRKLEAIDVGRVNAREDFKRVMELGKERLSRGISVLLFPQATRSEVFDESLFNTIGVKLAAHADVPIVPLALRTDFVGCGKVLRSLGPLHRERPVWFEFGEPFRVENQKAAHQRVVDFIETRLQDWGCVIRRKTEA